MDTLTHRHSTSAAAVRTHIGRASHWGARRIGQQGTEVRQALRRPSLQAKLSIGPVNDRYEQEADRVANQVMTMADRDVATVNGAGATAEPAVQRLCAPCEEEFDEAEREERPVEPANLCPKCSGGVQRLVMPQSADPHVIRRTLVSPYSIDDARLVGEEEATVQAKVDTSSATTAGVASTTAIRSVINRGGRPLPEATRDFMEPRFGQDFSGVRIHADRAADEAASAINARAFTLDRSIVFAQGQYAPHSHAGRHLLAHELTHVVQQSGGAADIQRDEHAAIVRRVRWGTARDTGVDAYPWNDGVRGDVFEVETDAGNPIDAWKPHDGTTYWCHGFTFGGADASGGPFSIWGSDVPQVLGDDGWRREESCRATPLEDILVFFQAPDLTHSGVVDSVVAPAVIVDESRSELDSKWGQAPQNQSPWLDNVRQYGRYQVYSKAPEFTPCAGSGANEGWEDLGQEDRCPPTPTGLGYQTPAPSCEDNPGKDVGRFGRHIRFCLDSDELAVESPANVMAFALTQPDDANFVVHGYASRDGARAYNQVLACHRANRVRQLLLDAGIAEARIETASKGPTDEFSGGPEFNRVVVLWPEVRRFGQQTPDPACPEGDTGLGNVQPDPACPDDPVNLLGRCELVPDTSVEERGEQCDFYHFCRDSDVLRPINTPADITAFARRQAAAASFTVHGFASEEGGHDYNVRLSCHRAKRVARELMNAGVPPGQISVAGKGPSSQIAGGLESNRIVIVHAQPPAVGPEPALPTETGRKTQEEKHALIDAAIANINRGTYALAADAYFSFWTCGRMPSLRHGVAVTHYLAEGDPGTPKIEKQPDFINVGRTRGLGLNNVVVSNEILEQHPQCIRDAVARMAFETKVRDEEFGSDHGRGSERLLAAEHMVFLAGLSCETEPRVNDPRADKPPPGCLGPLPPTLHGQPTAAQQAASVPQFVTNAFDALTSSGASRMLVDSSRDRLVLGTDDVPLVTRATVTLHGSPHEHGNYDVGFMITVARDQTDVTYAGGEHLTQQLPTPLRDTDGRRPQEPWFADDAFQVASGGRAEPFTFKLTAQEVPLHFERGGSAIDTVSRDAEYQLWLVARRHGAPLDPFATHLLTGVAVRFQQDLDVDSIAGSGSGSGRYRTQTPVTGADSSLLRYSGPVAEDLEPRETTTIDRVPRCQAAFNSVRLTLSGERATGVSGVIGPQRRSLGNGMVVVTLSASNPIDYSPTVAIEARTRQAPLDKFEAGLVQNILSVDSRGVYSSGEIVREVTLAPPPLRDGPEPGTAFAHDFFLSSHGNDMGQFSLLRKEIGLELRDVPGIGFVEDLATHFLCPNHKQGELRHMTGRHRFRTWVVVRFDQDNGCFKKLNHVDWRLDWAAGINPDNVERSAMEVTAQGGGGPAFVLGEVLPTTDDACEP